MIGDAAEGISVMERARMGQKSFGDLNAPSLSFREISTPGKNMTLEMCHTCRKCRLCQEGVTADEACWLDSDS